MSRLLKLRACWVRLAAGKAQSEPFTPHHTKLVFCDQSIERTLSWIEHNRRMSLGTTSGCVRAAKRSYMLP